MKLLEGRFQFIYNVGNSDIRIFDIFNDGQVKEKISKTNDVRFVSTDTALKYLDQMIYLAQKEAEKFKGTTVYSKTSKTKLDILLTIKRFLLENPVSEDEVRYF